MPASLWRGEESFHEVLRCDRSEDRNVVEFHFCVPCKAYPLEEPEAIRAERFEKTRHCLRERKLRSPSPTGQQVAEYLREIRTP